MEWCERRYSGLSPEYLNTMSSSIICISGCLLILNCRDITYKFLLAICLMLNGICSAAFHYYATEQYRIYDELTILIIAVIYTHIVEFNIFIIILFGVLFFLLILFYQYAALWLILCLIILYSARPSWIYISKKTKLLFVSSLSFWISDLLLCSEKLFFFHALWHISIAICAYYAINEICNSRAIRSTTELLFYHTCRNSRLHAIIPDII